MRQDVGEVAGDIGGGRRGLGSFGRGAILQESLGAGMTFQRRLALIRAHILTFVALVILPWGVLAGIVWLMGGIGNPLVCIWVAALGTYWAWRYPETFHEFLIRNREELGVPDLRKR